MGLYLDGGFSNYEKFQIVRLLIERDASLCNEARICVDSPMKHAISVVTISTSLIRLNSIKFLFM